MKGKGNLLIAALALAGCATPSAGTATSPVTAHLCIDGSQSGPVTATLTVTITPTSTAKQDAKADGKLDVTVPVKGP